ncbi:MAG: hypothetical protein H6704_24015 [Myxococcales bacterium]|nr:hypothetical protein [Myxococcales bacterium]
MEELKVWQRLQSNRLEAGIPDLLVVTIDANSYGPHGRAQQIERVLDRSLFPQAVLGCPDPYIERWAMADPAAFTEVVGCAPPPEPERKSRGLYKDLLHNTMAAANFPVLTTPMQEVAADIVSAMDPYRAGKRRPELGRFISDLRGALTLA